MPIIQTQQTQNVISGQEYLDEGATKELVGQLRGYAEGYNDGYNDGRKAFCWHDEELGRDVYTNFKKAPDTEAGYSASCNIIPSNDPTDPNEYLFIGSNILDSSIHYTKLSDTSFKLTYDDTSTYPDGRTLTRDDTKDFNLTALVPTAPLP